MSFNFRQMSVSDIQLNLSECEASGLSTQHTCLAPEPKCQRLLSSPSFLLPNNCCSPKRCRTAALPLTCCCNLPKTPVCPCHEMDTTQCPTDNIHCCHRGPNTEQLSGVSTNCRRQGHGALNGPPQSNQPMYNDTRRVVR